MTWEEAVRWYRELPGNEKAVRDNYFDLPVLPAAQRYAESEEFAEVLQVFSEGDGRRCLDLGAGNGIASYAFARHGWQVVALEPDPSAEVGAGAISAIASETGLPITVAREVGEKLPFDHASFGAVFGRQVLHHLSDLRLGVREIFRVLEPNGLFMATREHVVDNAADLAQFRSNHPLHALYGGENAHPLAEYCAAFEEAGFVIQKIWAPLDSVLNYYPGTRRQLAKEIDKLSAQAPLGKYLSRFEFFHRRKTARANRENIAPGRLYSFLLLKP